MFHIPKRLSAVLAPVAVIGALFAIPAMAQAQPVLEGPSGPLAKGDGVSAGSSNLVTEVPGLGTLTCSSVTLSGEVTNEKPAAVEGTGVAEGCLANGVFPAIVEPIEFDDQFVAGGTDEGDVLFGYSVPAAGLENCTFSGAIGTTWTDGSPEVKVLSSALAGGGSGCPPAGVLKGTITLGGGVVVVE